MAKIATTSSRTGVKAIAGAVLSRPSAVSVGGGVTRGRALAARTSPIGAGLADAIGAAGATTAGTTGSVVAVLALDVSVAVSVAVIVAVPVDVSVVVDVTDVVWAVVCAVVVVAAVVVAVVAEVEAVVEVVVTTTAAHSTLNTLDFAFSSAWPALPYSVAL
jgi:hypothetical protein